MLEQLEIDWRSPLDAFAPLAARSGAMLFHGGDAADSAEWSFILSSPVRTIVHSNGLTRIDGAVAEMTPFAALAAFHAERRLDCREIEPASFASGLAGFVGYECGGLIEPSAAGPVSPHRLPDFAFGAYDAVAVFNRRTQTARIVGRSAAALENVRSSLGLASRTDCEAEIHVKRQDSNFAPEDYRRAVGAVQQKIRAGELFQANISQRITVEGVGPIDAYQLFRRASATSSAGFGAFIPYNDGSIISLSPERFFSITAELDGRLKIVAEPIKGTRPRGRTFDDDARLLAELIADPKDRAENIMIADLTRSDLSRICMDLSIIEEKLCEPRTFAAVHHLVSRISGVLSEGVDAVGALQALFPCGSITGAPKVQAMKVIAEIEKTGRGPYCGAIGYIDDRGGADFSVAIRLAIADEGRLTIPVGGGITLRSDPQAEYDETLVKGRHFFGLLRQAIEGRR